MPTGRVIAEAWFELAGLRKFHGKDADAQQLYEKVTRLRSMSRGENHEDTLVAAANALFSRCRALPLAEARAQLAQMLDKLAQHM